MSDIDFKFLRAAVALMDELNTSRAAVRLGIGQSAMSKQISALHHALGYPLFIKQGRTMVPTAAGDAFVAQARIALGLCRKSKTYVAGCAPTYGSGSSSWQVTLH